MTTQQSVAGETLEEAIAAWRTAGVDLTQPIQLAHTRTFGGKPVAGCYYDGPAGTAWCTRYGAAYSCAVPGCGKVISSGYHGCIAPGLHPIMVCDEHVVHVKTHTRRKRR